MEAFHRLTIYGIKSLQKTLQAKIISTVVPNLF